MVVKIQNLDVLVFKHCTSIELNYYIELSTDFYRKRIFSLQSQESAVPILSFLFGSTYDRIPANKLISRTRKCIVFESNDADVVRYAVVEARNAAGFTCTDSNGNNVAILFSLAFAASIPHFMRGAVVSTGRDVKTREHWGADGSLSVRPEYADAVIVVDGIRQDVNEICRKCPMRLHRATGACKVLGSECLLLANSLFGGKICAADTLMTLNSGEVWQHSTLGWSGRLVPKWFRKHSLNLGAFKERSK